MMPIRIMSSGWKAQCRFDFINSSKPSNSRKKRLSAAGRAGENAAVQASEARRQGARRATSIVTVFLVLSLTELAEVCKKGLDLCSAPQPQYGSNSCLVRAARSGDFVAMRHMMECGSVDEPRFGCIPAHDPFLLHDRLAPRDNRHPLTELIRFSR